jgi:hydroxymethylpyrimidine pyrophosphatase-like HAD family hydrolase
VHAEQPAPYMLTLFSSCVWALAPTPRIVFTDCDGTMLRPDHTLSPAATAMLHTLHDRGIRVVPATGRARAGPWTESVLNTHPVLQRGNPGVYINGCCAFTEDGEALASTYLPPAVVERVLHWWTSSVDAKGSGLVAYVGGEALHVPGQSPASEQALVERLGALGDSPPRAVARSEVPVSEVFKMIVTVEEAARDQALRPLLAALLKADAGLTQAIPGYLEIVPTTATKVRRRPSSGLTSNTSPRGQPYFGPCAHGPVLRRLPDARPASSLSRRRRQHARRCWSGGA